MWIKKTKVEPIRQEVSNYCGPAVASMILASVETRTIALSQGQLMDYMTTWAGFSFKTTPLGLACGLNAFAPVSTADAPIGFGVDGYLLPNAACQALVSSIHASSTPAAVMIYAADHWVLVFGMQTDVEPLPGASYTIGAFWVVNPLTAVPEQIVYFDWISTYFTGCFTAGVVPAPFTIVADERRTRGATQRATGFEPLTFDVDPGPAEPPAGPFRRAVIQAALDGLRANGLADVAAGGRVEDVTFVPRADSESNRAYYLVSIAAPFDRSVSVRISFRGQNYLGALMAQTPLIESGKRLERFFQGGTLSVAFAGDDGTEKRDFTAADLTFRKGRDGKPLLVWSPSRESTSPYLPFYQAEYRGKTLFLRSDLLLAAYKLHPFARPSFRRELRLRRQRAR